MTDTLNSIPNQGFTTKPEFQSLGEISLTIIQAVTYTSLAQGIGSNTLCFLISPDDSVELRRGIERIRHDPCLSFAHSVAPK